MKTPLFGCGTAALLWGLFCGCVGIGMIIDPAKDAERIDGVSVGIVFGLMPFLVGLAMFGVAFVMRNRDRRVEQRLAWIRTRERFTIQEFADAYGMLPADAEALLLSLLHHPNAPRLVYHRKAREYFQRASLQEGARLVDRCSSCQSPQNIVLLMGEQGTCTACGATL